MRKIYTIFILISTISILIVSSCNKELDMQSQENNLTKQTPEKEATEQDKSEPSEIIPYASEEELESLKLSQNSDIIDYELARKLVVLELSTTNIAENLNWYDAALSEKPIIIYDLNGNPRNYDFIVIKDKKAIGTVRTEATKELTTSILKSAYPKLMEYSLPTRSLGQSSYFIDWQGNEYIGTLNKNRGLTSPTNLIPVNGSKNLARSQARDLKGQEIIDYVSQNILPKFVPSENEIRKFSLNRTNRDIDELEKLKLIDMQQELQDKYLGKKQQSVSFWNEIQNRKAEILNMPEVVLASHQRGFWSWIKKQVDKIWPQHDRGVHFIEKYNYRMHRYNYHDTGWCGPWVCGYIHYVNYKEDQYDFFENRASSWGGDKPMFPWQMKSALNDKSSRSIDLSIIPYFMDKAAFDNIQYMNRPAIRLCFSKGDLHWVLAYGVRRMGNALWTDYFFLQIDNNSKIENRNEDPEKPEYYTKVDIWNPWFLVKD
ncbi:MAG: hypothetical protein ACQPRH_01490 [Solitalea-like symbiont of Tyrophagus putrescentiae]